jgi:DEAD/DEAH box helicase domain-containing protein
MSVGVTYSTETGQYHIFNEENVADLVDQLIKADLVVGYNHVQFDYPVLQAYTIYDLASQTVNCDMMLDIERILGHRLKLDAVAQASLNASKTADGLDALKWWQLYKKTGDLAHVLNIAEYCCYDVKVTKEVHEFGLERGIVKYADRNGNEQEVVASWKKL